MHTTRLSSLDDATLRRELSRTVASERTATTGVLAHIAEFDARRLYLADACPTMHAYCVQVLHLSDGAAYKRIHAARAARRFPRILEEVAAGRLHLSAVCLLAPHLTDENVGELVAAATHRSKTEIEAWLARRFAAAIAPTIPRARVIPVRAAAAAEKAGDLLTAVLDPLVPLDSLPLGAVISHVAPAPATHVVQIPIDEETHALLREVQDLLGHTVRPGDVGALFRRALAGLRTELLKRKAGATTRPRKAAPRTAGGRTRTIPAPVRREVWTRDEGRCTFMSGAGRRCSATRAIEYDHVVPFARGGEATVAGLRLRCRAHNQYGAERAFGTEHMRRMRERPRPQPDRDVEAALRTLGCRGEEARRGALHAAGLGEPRIEARLRAALQFIGAGARAVRSAGSR